MDRAQPAGIGICLAGLQRTLFTWPVRTHFETHLVAPHVLRGHSVEVFITIVGHWGRDRHNAAQTRRLAEKAYRPRRVSLVEEAALTDAPGQHCSFSSPEHMDPYRSATQWLALRACYEDIEAVERQDGRSFDWLYRIRTDVVLLADTPLAAGVATADAEGSVFVPSGGLSTLDHFVCGNDQMFACPRRLCRPYFHLLEVWQSEHCQPARRGQT
eukprot:3263006-Prymnesium_polylepis.1